MWRGLVALLGLATACDSQYGAYFVIQSDVDFDRVELYFGTEVSSSGSGSGDMFATPTFGAQSGLVFDRVFDASDVAMTMPVLETTYYVPASDANQKLGAYVVAVGFAGDKPVGIAEFFDFDVPGDEVHTYPLRLEPWGQQLVERWGTAPGCIAWKRTRIDHESIVAVVHDDDRDCDALASETDCDDLCSASALGCGTNQTFCNLSGACAIGCNRSGLCAPTLCLPPATCSSTCSTVAGFDQRLQCGTSNTPEHIELYVERTDPKQLCITEMKFAPGVPCVMPAIEAQTGVDPGFSYSVTSDLSNLGFCFLHVTQTSTAVFGDASQHHLLISVGSDVIGPRRSMIVGVNPSSNMVGCTSTSYTVTMPSEPVYDCANP